MGRRPQWNIALPQLRSNNATAMGAEEIEEAARKYRERNRVICEHCGREVGRLIGVKSLGNCFYCRAPLKERRE